MNLHLLRIFAAVVKHNGFSRAADAIHVSQPAVSKAVRELESQLDIPLLERTGGRVRLTEAGRALNEHARSIFALERAADADLRGLKGLEHGTLTVGASRTIATYMLPPLLARFLDEYPAIDLKIVSGNTEEIARRLLRYELDLAFVEGPVDDASRIDRVHWRTDELVIVSGACHPIASHAVEDPSVLSDARWVIREEGSGTRAVTGPILEDIGIHIEHALEVWSTGAVVESVAAGLGLSLVSTEAVREPLKIGRLRIIDLPGIPRFERQLYRISLIGHPPSPSARAFTALAAGALAESVHQ